MDVTHEDRLADLLKPPTESEVARALAAFTAAVQAHYGDRLAGIYLFGSRARGDHRPDSDLDVAVVLDVDFTDWKERRALAGLAYEATFDSGLEIQAWPFTKSAWASTVAQSSLLNAARRDGVTVYGRVS